MNIALAFLIGGAFACFLVRSAVSDELEPRANRLLKNYGLIFLFLAVGVLAGMFGHYMGWN